MIRINTQESLSGSKIDLEGQLTGDFVDELSRCWLASGGYERKKVTLGLSAVTHIDQRGRRLLLRMSEQGVVFEGARLAVADALHEALHPTPVRS